MRNAIAALLVGGIDHLDRRSSGELLLMTASVFAPAFAVLLTSAEPPEHDRWAESAR